MKCVITGKETKNKTKNIPLTLEGRHKLKYITNEYNTKLKEKFVNSFKEKSGNSSEDALEAVEKLAPRVSSTFVLRQLVNLSADELLGKFDEAVENITDEVTEEKINVDQE